MEDFHKQTYRERREAGHGGQGDKTPLTKFTRGFFTVDNRATRRKDESELRRRKARSKNGQASFTGEEIARRLRTEHRHAVRRAKRRAHA